MRFFLSSFSCLLLSGCIIFSTPQKEIIVEKEYIIRTAPKELKELPEYPSEIRLENQNNLDVATFIVKSEEYILQLETKIKALINFYEQPK